MLKFLPLLFTLSVFFSPALKATGDTAYYTPKLYKTLWPDFCIDHLYSHPRECSEHSTDSWGRPQLTHLGNNSFEASIDPELVFRLSKYVGALPACSEQCDFLICQSCRAPVVRKRCSSWAYFDEDIIIEDNIDMEDVEQGVCYKCSCLNEWYSKNDLECSDDEDFVEDNWIVCQNRAVPHGYFDIQHKPFFSFFEQHLSYCNENPECLCYWPYRSKNACDISDIVYKRTLPLLEKFHPKINLADFPYSPNSTTHGLLSTLFIHSFFYSQYRQGLFQLAQWMELSSPNALGAVHGVVEDLCPQFLELYNECLEKHPHPKIYYERGMLHFHQGKTLDSLSDIAALIDWANSHERQDLLNSDLYLQEGTFYAELGLYDQAVHALSEAIRRDPNNKQAFFERACAYFELGNFDLALDDHLASGIVSEPIFAKSHDIIAFSKGLTKGIVQGSANAGVEFIPSLFSSFHGIGHGLWAFVKDPVEVSNSIVQAALACIDFIRSNTPKESLCRLVPELGELIVNWEQLSDEKRGRSIGCIIGKYGVDIFAGAGLLKGMKIFRDLKRANNLLTLEAMAISERNKTLIRLEATARAQARREVLRHANLKIQWDKQGKHIEGHRNFVPTMNRSILLHSDPERLINEFAGKGIREAKVKPGTPGYQEVVDFGEFIGYAVDRRTGQKIATKWGKIHYANDGVHIVPTNPRW